jgi:glycosyltransferase involved in cell wall biosynthesis
MPEDGKSTIVIASVLKPVDDSRMCEKIGQSLSLLENTVVHVIGFPAGSTPSGSQMKFHSLKKFNRLSLNRIIAPIHIFSIAIKLKPSIVIITTHELLWAGLLLKLFTGCRLVYDIQENYYRNVLYTRAFPLMLRPAIALYVRVKEVFSSLFIDHFFLAEKGYARELRFPRKRNTVLENKVKKPMGEVGRNSVNLSRNKLQLLFTGTLAESTGVFTAIDLAIQLHEVDQRIELKIMGYASLPETLRKIKEQIHPHHFIELVGGDTLVPHADIIKEIQQAHFGIIAYPKNPATENSIPTKLYEYLGFQLPIVMINHPAWVEICNHYSAAVTFDPGHIDPSHLVTQMCGLKFYDRTPQNVFWEDEEMKLFEAIRPLLNP